jgi:hypothetical protein
MHVTSQNHAADVFKLPFNLSETKLIVSLRLISPTILLENSTYLAEKGMRFFGPLTEPHIPQHFEQFLEQSNKVFENKHIRISFDGLFAMETQPV